MDTVVLKWSAILGLAPHYNGNKCKYFGWQLFLCVVFQVGLYSASQVLRELNGQSSVVAKVQLFLALLTLLCGSAKLRFGLPTWQIFFEELHHVDSDLYAVHSLGDCSNKRLSYAVVLLSVLIELPLVYSAVLTKNWTKFASKLCMAVLLYLYYFSMLLESYLLFHVAGKFGLVNKAVLKLQLYHDDSRVRSVTLLYERLDKVVSAYNKLFGLNILIQSIELLMEFIRLVRGHMASPNFDFLHVAFLMTGTAKYVAVGILLICPNFVDLKCANFVVPTLALLVVALATGGEALSNAANEAKHLVSETMNRCYPNQQLSQLLQQCTARDTKVTAQGFFPVNHSMLFTFVNFTATYVIVVVQFM